MHACVLDTGGSEQKPSASSLDGSRGGWFEGTMTEQPSKLRFHDNTDARRYEAHLGDELAGLLEYHAQPGLVTLLHTEVPRAFEGQGIASGLIGFALEDIRERGLQVLPVCPFVIAYLERHPEQRDLLRYR